MAVAGFACVLAVVTPLLIAPILRRRLAERRRLEEATDMLRLAQAAAGAGVWDWNIRRDRLTLSPDSARMYGLPVAAGADAPVVLLIAEWKNLVVVDDLPKIWQAVKRNATTDTTNVAEFRTRPANGGQRRIRSFGHAVMPAEGGRHPRGS